MTALGCGERVGNFTVGEPFPMTPAGWQRQKPYSNGITVWNGSGSSGRGFGFVRKVAVRDGIVVAVYESAYQRQRAVVLSVGEIYSDIERDNRGEIYTTRTALSKWIAAVKGL